MKTGNGVGSTTGRSVGAVGIGIPGIGAGETGAGVTGVPGTIGAGDGGGVGATGEGVGATGAGVSPGTSVAHPHCLTKLGKKGHCSRGTSPP
jgi:hypothetical protein